MLNKLMKYEFRATSRLMLPLCLLVLVMAAGVRVFCGILGEGSAFSNTDTGVIMEISGFNVLNFLSVTSIVGFVLAMIAAVVVAFVLMILRFRTNLLGDEGYVMFTLPVSSHQLVWSKLLVSTVWFLVTAAVDCLGLLIALSTPVFYTELVEVLREIMTQLQGHGPIIIAEFVVLFLLSCLAFCLEFYAPLSIGHSFARHKMLLSVVFFFVIQFALQTIGSLMLAGLLVVPGDWELSPTILTHGIMGISILATLVQGIIFYLLTQWMLRSRLNLE